MMSALAKKIDWYQQPERRRWKQLWHAVELALIGLCAAAVVVTVAVYASGPRAPLNNSAQLCASAAGFQSKAEMAGNGQSFSTLPTTLWKPAARALRGAPENSSSVSPIFAVAG
jgi:hypothetical protein